VKEDFFFNVDSIKISKSSISTHIHYFGPCSVIAICDIQLISSECLIYIYVCVYIIYMPWFSVFQFLASLTAMGHAFIHTQVLRKAARNSALIMHMIYMRGWPTWRHTLRSCLILSQKVRTVTQLFSVSMKCMLSYTTDSSLV